MPAYGLTDKNSTNSGGIIGGKKTTSNDSTKGAVQTAGRQAQKAGNQVEKAAAGLDGFQKWAGKFFDWIAVKIDRLTQSIDKNTSQSEDAIYLHTQENPKKKKDAKAVYDNKLHELGKNDYVQRAINVTSNLKKTYEEGAKKYGLQAEKVLNEAAKDGVVKGWGAKQYATLAEWVRTGKNSIEDYGDEVKAVIEEYQKWYDLQVDCEAKIIETNKQLKELEQTKLDNIVERFETLVEYADSVKNFSASMIDYYTAHGTDNYKNTKEEYNKQIQQQKRITTEYEYEEREYKNELKRAEKIFGKDSNEYREAMTKLQDIQTAKIESQIEDEKLRLARYELRFKPIDSKINEYSADTNKWSSVLNLKEARGTIIGTDGKPLKHTKIVEYDYLRQMEANNNLTKQYIKDREKRYEEIKHFGWLPGSEKYEEAMEYIRKDDEEIIKLRTDAEKIKDAIVDLRWKPFRELSNQLDENIDDFEHLKSLMNLESLFDQWGEGGNFTQQGLDYLALIGEQMAQNDKKNLLYLRGLKKLDEELAVGNISLEEYTEKHKEYKEVIQLTAEANKKFEDELVDLYITKIQNENNLLLENINKRKEALLRTKEYYDYAKTLRGKNKDINLLRAQIAALQGVSDMASQARLATLRAQLAEKEDDLNETMEDHNYEIKQTGYDKLAQDANKTLEDEIAKAKSNTEYHEQIVQNMLGHVKKYSTETLVDINSMIENTGTVIAETSDKALEHIKMRLALARLLISEFLNPSDETKQTDAYKNADEEVDKAIDKVITSQVETGNNTIINGEKEVAENKTNGGELPKLSKTTTAANNKTTTTTTEENKVVKQVEHLVDQYDLGKLSAEASNKNRLQLESQRKQVESILKSATKSKNKKAVTDKTVSELYNYLRTNYGVVGDDDLYRKLQKELGVAGWKKNAGKKVTSDEKKAILAALKALNVSNKGFAKGTLGTKKDEFNWTHEGEIIRRSDGAILRQLPAGTLVVPKITSENLMKWGLIDPNKWVADIANSIGSVSNNQSQNNNIYYDSIIHVDGSVDIDVMDRLEELGKALLNNRDFTQGTVNMITKEYKREARKTGMR